jgi:hypothetical protein
MTIRKRPRGTFSPEALVIFRHMQRLDDACTCDDIGDENRRCAACDEWWQHHSRLHDLLRCFPWQWPCVVAPELADADSERDQDAAARYDALDAAAKAM